MPAYNASATIADSINSVLSQSYKEIELLVVDDGSTDDTFEIIEKISQVDKRLRIIKQQNHGVSAARNKGILEAKSKYIAFLDADDTYYPHRFENQIEILNSRNDVGLVYSRHCVKTASSQNIEKTLYAFPASELGRTDMANFLLKTGYFFRIDSCLIRRECLHGLNFNESLPTGEDFDFVLRASQICKFMGTHEYTVAVLRGHQSLTKRKSEFIYINEKKVVEMFIKESNIGLLGYVKARSYQHLRFSKRFQNHNSPLAWKHCIYSIVYNPFNVLAYKHFIGQMIL
jgi:alpha-1,6-rhamnosyltransferase